VAPVIASNHTAMKLNGEDDLHWQYIDDLGFLDLQRLEGDGQAFAQAQSVGLPSLTLSDAATSKYRD
jgi:hypothetical protein